MLKLFLLTLFGLNFFGMNCLNKINEEIQTNKFHEPIFEKNSRVNQNESTELCLTALEYLFEKSDEYWAINGEFKILLK